MRAARFDSDRADAKRRLVQAPSWDRERETELTVETACKTSEDGSRPRCLERRKAARSSAARSSAASSSAPTSSSAACKAPLRSDSKDAIVPLV
jgi:hypothetical protein